MGYFRVRLVNETKSGTGDQGLAVRGPYEPTALGVFLANSSQHSIDEAAITLDLPRCGSNRKAHQGRVDRYCRQASDGQELDAGFYEESDPAVQSEFPEGYLLHNLEHGYTIFWYNCDLLDEASCSNLKTEIKSVMDDLNNFKVIGFPRKSIESSLVTGCLNFTFIIF